ncbi:unnamed protein product [Ilex paraguariensis]|uniref:Uncharacterized protein n=1 Tax=Ilex paraguariensis TaxID=185542 RepID=A0ABC8UMB2_9AQUA
MNNILTRCGSWVLLIGGSTGTMLEALQVVGDGHGGPLGESFEEDNGYIAPSYDGEPSSGNRLKMKLKEFHKSTSSFTALDRNYLTPFFTTQNGDEEEQGLSLFVFLWGTREDLGGNLLF